MYTLLKALFKTSSGTLSTVEMVFEFRPAYNLI